MFASYRLEDPKTAKIVKIGSWSYLWAGLFGALYMFFKAGRQGLFQGIALTLVCTLALAALAMVTSILPVVQQLVALVLGAPTILIFQSVKMVTLIRKSYRRRRWIVRRED